MESFLLLSSIFHFSFRPDTSEHDKGVQERTEGQEHENMCDENLENKILGENVDICDNYEN